MGTSYVRAELRRLIAERAERLCEYCLIHEDDMFFGCEVDHIISQKHGGPTRADNLAFACLLCNRNKGSDIASLVRETGELVRFFNPRTDRWGAHFSLHQDGITIEPITEIGQVTVLIFDFNHSDRLLEREALKKAGRYPMEAALRRMRSSVDL